MLVESVFAASSSAPANTVSNPQLLKDAGIFHHQLHPHPALRETWKKSTASPGCLAVSETHLFTAQSSKALLNVYERGKNSAIATVPLPERVTSIALALEDSILICGTESGRVLVWDTATGHSVWSAAAHLDAVTAVVADAHDSHFVTGSRDASVLVWSLLDFLSLTNRLQTHGEGFLRPRQSLIGHNGAITAVALGHSAVPARLAITAGNDCNVIVWDYTIGKRLRTVVLESPALCLAVDPAERAVYTGHANGTVQRVDLSDPKQTAVSIRANDQSLVTKAAQNSSSTSNGAPEKDFSALCIDLSTDGTLIISGHADGTIRTWDAGTLRVAETLACHSGASITNVQVSRPSCLSGAKTRASEDRTIVKAQLQSGSRAGKRGQDIQYLAPCIRLRKHNIDQPTARSKVERAFEDDGLEAWLLSPPVQASNGLTLTSDPRQTDERNPEGVTDAEQHDYIRIDEENAIPNSSATHYEELHRQMAAKDDLIAKLLKERDALSYREQALIKRRASRIKAATNGISSKLAGSNRSGQRRGAAPEEMSDGTANSSVSTTSDEDIEGPDDDDGSDSGDMMSEDESA